MSSPWTWTVFTVVSGSFSRVLSSAIPGFWTWSFATVARVIMTATIRIPVIFIASLVPMRVFTITMFRTSTVVFVALTLSTATVSVVMTARSRTVIISSLMFLASMFICLLFSRLRRGCRRGRWRIWRWTSFSLLLFFLLFLLLLLVFVLQFFQLFQKLLLVFSGKSFQECKVFFRYFFFLFI